MLFANWEGLHLNNALTSRRPLGFAHSNNNLSLLIVSIFETKHQLANAKDTETRENASTLRGGLGPSSLSHRYI